MVRLGVLLPTRESTLRAEADASQLISFARAAQDARFDSVWAGDSLTARPRLEPLTLLAGVAAACEEITVGTAALTGSLRHPILAAHAIATLDQVSGGRLVLGLGAGFPYPETEAEFAVAGARFDQRVGRLREAVGLWRLLWDPERDPEKPLSFEGRYWSFDGIEGLTRPTRPGGPPVWLAGAGQKSLRSAGRYFDGWLPYLPEPADYARALQEVRSAQTGGRWHPFTPAQYLTVTLDDDPRTARTELSSYIQAYYGLPLEIMETLQASFAGRPDWCAEWIASFIEAGAEHLIVRFGSLDGRAQLDRFASDVLPKLEQIRSGAPPAG